MLDRTIKPGERDVIKVAVKPGADLGSARRLRNIAHVAMRAILRENRDPHETWRVDVLEASGKTPAPVIARFWLVRGELQRIAMRVREAP